MEYLIYPYLARFMCSFVVSMIKPLQIGAVAMINNAGVGPVGHFLIPPYVIPVF
jgi:hypothetical protein